MAAEIKGITIELNGDTSNLQKALREVRKEAKDFDKELSYIDNSLKFNPRNVDLLKQKIAVLNDATKAGEKNINEMKKALQQMKDNGVDETSAEYRELERAIIKAENQQKAYNKELRKLEGATSKLGQAAAKMKDFGSKAEAAGEALRGVSMAAAGIDVALAGLAYTSGKTADELNTMAKVTGISTQELQKYKAAADLVDVSVESIANAQKKMKASMLTASSGTGAVAEAYDKLGVAVTDANGELRNQDDVFTEAIAALGKMENETERDALAMKIFGKSAADLNPLIEDNGETYKKVADIFNKNQLSLVDQETIDKANAFNDTLDEIKMTGMAALSSIGMQLAGYLQPALEKIAGAIEKVFSWLSQLDPEILTIIGIIAGVVAALSPVLIVVGKLAFAISSIMSLMATLGPAIGGIIATAAPIVAAIAAIIAVGVLLYKNWDTIKAKALEIKDWVVAKWNELKTKVEGLVIQLKTKVLQTWEAIKTGLKQIALDVYNWSVQKFTAIRDAIVNVFNGLKNTVTTIWEGIKYAITNPIGAALTVVKTVVDKIKALFSNLKISIPHIKTPHFSITPAGWKIGDLLKGIIPKLGINWYKTGGIFNSPSVIGVGEAGPEAVIPIDKLREIINGMGAVNINVYATPGMDVNALALEVQKKLITLENRRKQAWL